MTRKQCKACPWRVDVVPDRDIPNGYDEQKHCKLTDTISDGRLDFASSIRVMACHETPIGKEKPCVGWLANQLGPGNNISLRLLALAGKIDADFKLVGEQHARFEDTLP